MLFERSGPQAFFWRAASGTPSCTGQICRKESTRNRAERRKPTRHSGVCVCACVCTCVRALVHVYVEVCILITRDAALGQPGEQQCKWEAASNRCGDRVKIRLLVKQQLQHQKSLRRTRRTTDDVLRAAARRDPSPQPREPHLQRTMATPDTTQVVWSLLS